MLSSLRLLTFVLAAVTAASGPVAPTLPRPLTTTSEVDEEGSGLGEDVAKHSQVRNPTNNHYPFPEPKTKSLPDLFMFDTPLQASIALCI